MSVKVLYSSGLSEMKVIGRVLLYAVMTAGLSMAQPIVSLQSLPQYGVTLEGSDTSDFQSKLASDRVPEGDALLPYIVLIKNSSEKEIIAYTVLWTNTDNTGKVVTQSTTIRDFSRLRPGDNLRPNGSHLVSVVPGIGRSGAGIANELKQSVPTFLAFYSEQKTITISVDSVIFADGLAVGEDKDLSIPKLKAWLDGERDLAREVLATQPGDLKEALQKTVAATHGGTTASQAQTGQATQATSVGLQIHNATTYESTYKLVKAYFAKQLLNNLNTSSSEDLIKQVRDFTTRKIYPNVHR